MNNELRTYCEAKTRAGKNCRQPSGNRTNHPGTGRCWLHGGRSTGARTPEGKANQTENARTHGLYSKILSAKDLERLQETQEYDPSEILKDNFYLVQSRTLGLLENENRFAKEAKVLLQACAILVENGELSEDFVDDGLRKILHQMDVAHLSRIYNSSAGLIHASVALDQAGAINRQLDISKRLLVNILKTSHDQNTRLMALNAIEELKVDAGLPVDELDSLLAIKDEEVDNEDVDTATEEK